MNLVCPRPRVDLDHLRVYRDGHPVSREAAQHAVEGRHEEGVADLGNGLAPVDRVPDLGFGAKDTGARRIDVPIPSVAADRARFTTQWPG